MNMNLNSFNLYNHIETATPLVTLTSLNTKQNDNKNTHLAPNHQLEIRSKELDSCYSFSLSLQTGSLRWPLILILCVQVHTAAGENLNGVKELVQMLQIELRPKFDV